MELNNSLLPLCMFKYVSLILYVHICTEHMPFAMCIYVMSVYQLASVYMHKCQAYVLLLSVCICREWVYIRLPLGMCMLAYLSVTAGPCVCTCTFTCVYPCRHHCIEQLSSTCTCELEWSQWCSFSFSLGNQLKIIPYSLMALELIVGINIVRFNS